MKGWQESMGLVGSVLSGVAATVSEVAWLDLDQRAGAPLGC